MIHDGMKAGWVLEPEVASRGTLKDYEPLLRAIPLPVARPGAGLSAAWYRRIVAACGFVLFGTLGVVPGVLLLALAEVGSKALAVGDGGSTVLASAGFVLGILGSAVSGAWIGYQLAKISQAPRR